MWKRVISLEQAARKISKPNIEENKIKTKIRRLYDIANVLSSLRLIEKTSLDTRKPAFKWVGIKGLDLFMKEMLFDLKHFGGIREHSPFASNLKRINSFSHTE